MTDSKADPAASPFRVPHTLALMFIMMVVALVLTWVLPAGEFETVVNESGREVVVPGTYETLEDAGKLSAWALFTSVPRAMADAQGIIFFVLIIGGALRVIRETGAIDAFLGSVIDRYSHNSGLLIFFGVFLFAAASATLGMAEEYIPFAGILIAVCVAMRMDTVAAIGIMVVGYGVGYGATIMNPFTLLIAQDVAELQPASGWGYRLALFVPFLAIGVHHVWSYARKVQRDPSASLVHGIDEAQPPPQAEQLPMTWSRIAVLAATFGALALLLEDGQVLHTIVNAMASPLVGLPAELSAVGMLGIQSIMNIFVSSGSGQAYLTMPLMAPIGDLVGIERQVSVLAYQFGDGFMNMIVPTNPVLMGILGLAGIPYARWFRFVLPLILKLLAMAALAMVVAVWIGYN